MYGGAHRRHIGLAVEGEGPCVAGVAATELLDSSPEPQPHRGSISSSFQPPVGGTGTRGRRRARGAVYSFILPMDGGAC